MAVYMKGSPYEKQPAEQETIEIDWTDRAGNLVVVGYVLGTVEVKIFDSSGVDVTSTMTQGSPSITGFKVYVTIKAGTAGNQYKLRCRATLTKAGATDQTQEADLLIKVTEKGA